MRIVEVEAIFGTPQGLHMRPSKEVIDAANALMQEAGEPTTIKLVNLDHPDEGSRSQQADANSIMSLLMMAVSFGHRLNVVVETGSSETAERIAAEMARLLASNLDDTSAELPQLVESA